MPSNSAYTEPAQGHTQKDLQHIQQVTAEQLHASVVDCTFQCLHVGGAQVVYYHAPPQDDAAE